MKDATVNGSVSQTRAGCCHAWWSGTWCPRTFQKHLRVVLTPCSGLRKLIREKPELLGPSGRGKRWPEGDSGACCLRPWMQPIPPSQLGAPISPPSLFKPLRVGIIQTHNHLQGPRSWPGSWEAFFCAAKNKYLRV